MKTTTDPHDWKEGRRLRAFDLVAQGWKPARVAEALGVTRGAVSQWLSQAREGGREALRHRRPPGKTPALSAEQRSQLPTFFAKGAEAYGFVGDVWTTKRVAVVIRREFGVRHHPAHVSRILGSIGWSVQKPVVRARQRDEAQITAWQAERWPALEAKLTVRGARSCS